MGQPVRGKDAAPAPAAARRAGARVTGLLSTVTRGPGGAEIAVHGVGAALVAARADAPGLPLYRVELPPSWPDGEYRARLRAALAPAAASDVTGLVHGDLALGDVRAFREEVLDGTGVAGVFPLWGAATDALAAGMLDAGLRAVVVAVDPGRVPARLAGAAFDAGFLAALPPGVDPCGENGEFHTFVTGGPGFAREVPVAVTGTVARDGHVQAVPAPAGWARQPGGSGPDRRSAGPAVRQVARPGAGPARRWSGPAAREAAQPAVREASSRNAGVGSSGARSTTQVRARISRVRGQAPGPWSISVPFAAYGSNPGCSGLRACSERQFV
ncbi:hypothetical protein GCM10025792_21900 [Pseudonocardia tropica]|uniref:Dph6-related ATP pyrophosphatase n=1 Tax=Pseudonocardia tropica TaxID=681289 RepID=UPI00337FA8E2